MMQGRQKDETFRFVTGGGRDSLYNPAGMRYNRTYGRDAEPSLPGEVPFLLYLDLDGGRNEIRCAKQGDVL